jgi:hypothetical protein
VTVLAGRLPRLGAADEIVLTAGLARFFHAGVGGHVTYQFYRQNPANASVSAGRPTFVATGIVGIPPVLGDQFDQVNNAVLPRRPPPGTLNGRFAPCSGPNRAAGKAGAVRA